MAAFDFPTSPIIGDLYPPSPAAGVPQYRWNGNEWTTPAYDPLTFVLRGGDTMLGYLTLNGPPSSLLHAATKQYVDSAVSSSGGTARNRITNGAMQISQENGNTAGTTNNFYPVDEWRMIKVHSVGTMTVRRAQSVTPKGSKDRIRLSVTTADNALAIGEYLTLVQPIEGLRVADFGYGIAGAKTTTLRFGFRAPAGTYSIAVQNSAKNRSYVANFTITAGQTNTDTEQTFVIPGDTTGTWLVDTSAGLILTICVASGTTFQGVAGWQATNKFATVTNTNGMAVVGNTFELFDVGLYVGSVASPWEAPDYEAELTLCQRYYNKYTNIIAFTGYNDAGTGFLISVFFKTMRAVPAVAFSTIVYNNASGLGISTVQVDNACVGPVATAAGTASASFNIEMKARL